MPSAYSVHKCNDAQYKVTTSVADPFKFDTDPDPRIRINAPKNDLNAINKLII